MATVNGKILAVPPGVSVAEHMENHSTPSRGSPIQVGGQGRGESEDAIRELYDRELRDAEDKIATLTKKEQVMKNVMSNVLKELELFIQPAQILQNAGKTIIHGTCVMD